jgi:hypothetical protein
MKTFNVYKHPMLGLEAVKIGFSWPAFALGLIWMVSKKLWGWAGLWFGATVVCTFIEAATIESQAGGEPSMVYLFLIVAYLALWFIPPFQGNKWLEASLSKRGYEHIGTVQAETPDAAIAQSAKPA